MSPRSFKRSRFSLTIKTVFLPPKRLRMARQTERNTMKKTTDQLIKELKFKKPNPIINGVLSQVARLVYFGPCKVDIKRNVEPNDYKDKPVIVVANHASRFDYAFVNFAMRRRPINFVAAENEFHRSKFKLVFKLGHVIPKRNFVPDVKTIKGMSHVLRREKNGCVAIFPCGMSTASGAQQPVVSGTGKMLKHFGVHVLAVRIYGGYLVCPKFDIKERFGKVELQLDELFTPEQLKELSAEEIERKVDEALFVDDYAWNATRQNFYNRKDGNYAQNMEQIIYKCPACGTEMQMRGEGKEIKCLHCDNGAVMDGRYNLTPIADSKIPTDPRAWFDWERREMRKRVQDPNFAMEEHVRLGLLPKYGYLKHNAVYEVVGEGVLRLDREGMSYTGTRNGDSWTVFIPRDKLSTICLPVDGSFFYTYASGEFLAFCPSSPSSMRWSHAVEEVYRTGGGKWGNFPWFDYDAPLVLKKKNPSKI